MRTFEVEPLSEVGLKDTYFLDHHSVHNKVVFKFKSVVQGKLNARVTYTMRAALPVVKVTTDTIILVVHFLKFCGRCKIGPI